METFRTEARPCAWEGEIIAAIGLVEVHGSFVPTSALSMSRSVKHGSSICCQQCHYISGPFCGQQSHGFPISPSRTHTLLLLSTRHSLSCLLGLAVKCQEHGHDSASTTTQNAWADGSNVVGLGPKSRRLSLIRWQPSVYAGIGLGLNAVGLVFTIGVG
jgi:hypothetical protein